MPVETGVQDISDLNEAWPLSTDHIVPGIEVSQHLRNVKAGIRGSFTDLAANGGVVTVSADEMNHTAGLTGNVKDQLDAKEPAQPWENLGYFNLGGGVADYQGVVNKRHSIARVATISRFRLPETAGLSPGDYCYFFVHDNAMGTSYRVNVIATDNFYWRNAAGVWILDDNTENRPQFDGGWPVVSAVFLDGVWRVWLLNSASLI